MAAASAAEPLAEGVPPPLSPPAGGCWPSTWDGRGLSLQGLRIVAEQADGRSAAELWKEDWMRECAPPGWAAECIISDDRWVCDRLTCVATGDVWEKTAAAFNGCNAPAVRIIQRLGVCDACSAQGRRRRPLADAVRS